MTDTQINIGDEIVALEFNYPENNPLKGERATVMWIEKHPRTGDHYVLCVFNQAPDGYIGVTKWKKPK